jgi:hypothetical protein
MINCHTPIRQHQRQIAVANRKGKVPAQRPQDHLGREMPSFERPLLIRRHALPDAPNLARLPNHNSCRACNITLILLKMR